MDEFQENIQRENKELFEAGRAVDDFARLLLRTLNERQIKLFELPPHKRIFLFILTRIMKTCSAVDLLCRNGYGQDAAALVRGLLENLITAKYIIHDPRLADERAKRFVAYKWVILKRHIPEQEKNIRGIPDKAKNEFFERKELILKRVDEFKREYKISSDRALLTWSGRTLKDMAKRLGRGLLNEYESTFRLSSRFSHPGILGDREYLVQDEKSLVFSPLPSTIGIVLNMTQNIKFYMDFLDTADDLFQLHLTAQLNGLKSKCGEVFQMKKYAEDIPPQKPAGKTPGIKESVIVFKTHE